MALKGSPNKNRKKIVKQPITIADIAAIREMDHEQLYEKLEKTLGTTKNKKMLDKKPEESYNVFVPEETPIPMWKYVGFLSVLFLLILI